MRYLERTLTELDPRNDVLVVLRHPEDAQQTNDRLLDFLTTPGSFVRGVPELRVTTPSHYPAEVQRRRPSVVIWAASAVLGARAYIGDAYCPPQFQLVVAGQDAGTLHRILNAVPADGEYAVYGERVDWLLSALPWTPKGFGALSTALGLDVDRRRGVVSFTGQGYLLLDGYGKLSAGPGSQFYVLDPVSHQLAPREARAIEIGDAVFVMPDFDSRGNRSRASGERRQGAHARAVAGRSIQGHGEKRRRNALGKIRKQGAIGSRARPSFRTKSGLTAD